MTVRANDLALFHLVEHVLPPPFGEVSRDLKRFVALPLDVVELEHYWIALSAVDARMGREVLQKEEGALNAA